MKSLLVIISLIFLLLSSSCSKLPGYSDCKSAVDNSLLQEVFENNINYLVANHPLELYFCQLKNAKQQLCNIKVEVSDINEVSKNAFATTCTASIRYSATLRMGDYKKERQMQIDKINEKASSDELQAREYVIKTFENYNVTYTETDLQDGIAKREVAIKKNQQEDLARFYSGEVKLSADKERENLRNFLINKSNGSAMLMQEEPIKKSYFLVAEAAYTVTQGKENMNLKIEDLTFVAEGE